MGNTVGSLDQFQRSILVGTIPGDGYSRRLKGRADDFLEINRSINQRDYVDWKYNQLKSFVINWLNPVETNLDLSVFAREY